MAQNTFAAFRAKREACAQYTTENGEIFAWYQNPANEKEASWSMRFNTEADFKAYTDEVARIYKGIDMEPAQLMAGTEADFKKAVKAWQRKHDQERNAGYDQKADKEIARYRACVELLEALPAIMEKFAGKVLNKRIHDAVKEATGFSSTFTSTGWEFKHYGYNYPNYPYICLYDLSICKAYRLEASDIEQALAKIADQKERQNTSIADMEATKGQYMEYVRKCNELARQINELQKATHFSLREYARNERDLIPCDAKYIWN